MSFLRNRLTEDTLGAEEFGGVWHWHATDDSSPGNEWAPGNLAPLRRPRRGVLLDGSRPSRLPPGAARRRRRPDLARLTADPAHREGRPASSLPPDRISISRERVAPVVRRSRASSRLPVSPMHRMHPGTGPHGKVLRTAYVRSPDRRRTDLARGSVSPSGINSGTQRFGGLAVLPTSGLGSVTKPSRLGIVIWGRVRASMTSVSPMMPFRWRRYAVTA